MKTWRLSMTGVGTVMSLEINQRLRSRWVYVALGVWLVVIAGATVFAHQAMRPNTWWTGGGAESSLPASQVGYAMFSVIVAVALVACLVIGPAFAAASVAMDREQGVLAVLQATPLSPLDIAVGKLLASWLISGILVLCSAPFMAWAVYIGGISLAQVGICVGVMLLEAGVFCAIGLGWSAISSRTIVAVIMSYLSVLTLALLSFLIFLVSGVFVSEKVTMRTWGLESEPVESYGQIIDDWVSKDPPSNARPPAPPFDQCGWLDYSYEADIAHTEYTWWTLLVNPFVIVAEAAPLPAQAKQDLYVYSSSSNDILGGLKHFVRNAQMGEKADRNECGGSGGWTGFSFIDRGDGTWTIVYYGEDFYESEDHPTWISEHLEIPEGPVPRRVLDADTIVWPYGLASNLALGLLFFCIAVVRLKVPYRKLAKGMRVA